MGAGRKLLGADNVLFLDLGAAFMGASIYKNL
jgi:hypothetical protein